MRTLFGKALQNIKESSIKNKWDMEGPDLLVFKPWICFISSSIISKDDKPLEHRRKRKG